ncbi:alpha/beta fold hydrolase [Caldimonas tepidiphila]|uniref:alpha/beta fold hydrolase n=1 Tax=Caldimonas tepidiphila TaxID=2315841 RepID=UPI000E5A27DF|nr:alpha/beta hydrolase [Caldimonas tepidiphila]
MSRSTVVLLPGLLCDEAVWAGQRQALSEFADCVVPSYGEQDSIRGMAQDVLAALPHGPLSLAGHSMGGRVALEMMRMAPGRIEQIALLDTGLEPIAAGEAGEAERAKRFALLHTAQQAGMRAMGREWARGMVHPSRLDSPLFEDILAMIERSTPRVFAAQINALLGRPDAREVFRAARCPTLLVCGRQDAWSPLSRHEQMQQMRPDARLVVVEDSGHMAPMEQPEAVSLALAAWLRDWK